MEKRKCDGEEEAVGGGAGGGRKRFGEFGILSHHGKSMRLRSKVE